MLTLNFDINIYDMKLLALIFSLLFISPLTTYILKQQTSNKISKQGFDSCLFLIGCLYFIR